MSNDNKVQKRRSEIIRTLSELSRGGWAKAKPDDYIPLERELCNIEEAELIRLLSR